MKHYNAVFILPFGLFLLQGLTSPATGTIIDLTPGGTSHGTVNGAIFEFSHDNGGTGVIEPFVRLHANNSEHGYNTSNSSTPFDEKVGSWTHDLRLDEIPYVKRVGIPYLEFVLDINENTGNGDEFISLDALRLYTSSYPSQNTTDFAQLGTLRYDLDAGEDSVILMNYNNAPGSGQTDMTMYLPVSAFIGVDPSQYVYFYSQFGTRPVEGTGSDRKDWGTSDGFEEWAVDLHPTTTFLPDPATLTLMALGTVAMLKTRR